MATKTKTPAKKSKAPAKSKAKPSKRKPKADPKLEVEFPAVDEDTMNRAFELFAEACDMLGWTMAVGVGGNEEIHGICAGNDEYMLDMIGQVPSKEE